MVFECISGNKHRPSFTIQIGKYWFYNYVARDVLFIFDNILWQLVIWIIDICSHNFSIRLTAGEKHHILIIALFFLVKMIDWFMCTVVRNVIHEKSQNNFIWKWCELGLTLLWKWDRYYGSWLCSSSVATKRLFLFNIFFPYNSYI